MADPTNFRQERIEKLLHELRYEIERGLIEREIAEEMGFEFVFPISHKIPDGVVRFRMDMRPVHRLDVGFASATQPRLKVVR